MEELRKQAKILGIKKVWDMKKSEHDQAVRYVNKKETQTNEIDPCARLTKLE